ncbi:MAG: hypothetical protein A2Y33_13605 [Spirochaetes bacterium GWF1_51_8]|nr:MAG: hypothetical protein A2Y33_13605 [Spirochaetes bacterium GWF1_51_8]
MKSCMVFLSLIFAFAASLLLSPLRADGDFDDGQNLSGEYLDPDFVEILPLYLIEEAGASSTLKSQGKNTYGVENLFDMNAATCWVEGVKGYGKGEWVEIGFLYPIHLTAVGFANGYQKSKKVYNENSDIHEMKVTVWYDSESGGGNESFIYIFTKPGYCQEDIYIKYNDLIRLADYLSTCGIRKIRFTILDVYPGEKYDDTCISEIVLYGGLSAGGDSAP